MMAEDISKLKEAEQQEVRTEHNWTGGAVLIGLGVIFLLNNLEIFHLDNWWALFILIPALVNFSTAWHSYREDGRFTSKARGAVTGGIILLLVASTFLFGWSWSMMWPLFLIVGGLSAIFSSK